MNQHTDLIPNLISRSKFNTRRRLTISVCNAIRERIANEIDGGESFFCINSKPIEVCRIARSSRCKLGKSKHETAPSFVFCASQNTYYYGYKLHAVCGLSGAIHSFGITKANIHDINHL
ncbi:MAG: transposase [Bacteroidales bacterium]|nr:transposase [Bacteroidales bacterium]